MRTSTDATSEAEPGMGRAGVIIAAIIAMAVEREGVLPMTCAISARLTGTGIDRN
jgi:hypothetical protein